MKNKKKKKMKKTKANVRPESAFEPPCPEDLNVPEQKCDIQNIQSKFIIKQILENIQKRKVLDILKCNKEVKIRVDIDINDYKKCCEEFSTIEIEIIPNDKYYTKIININKENEQYIHIFFNQNEKEANKDFFPNQIKLKK